MFETEHAYSYHWEVFRGRGEQFLRVLVRPEQCPDETQGERRQQQTRQQFEHASVEPKVEVVEGAACGRTKHKTKRN
jgi:phenylacetate-coenzyme A ligase PaaK-like adenylate-forming protein